MMALRALFAALALLAAGLSGAISPAQAAQGKGCLPLTGAFSGVSYFQLLNAEIAGLGTLNSGAMPPLNCGNAPALGQQWLDTSTTVPWLRLWNGNKWLPLAAFDVTNNIYEPQIGGGIATLAAASVTDLCATPESSISIVGGTTINSFGTSCAIGQLKLITFASVLSLAQNPAGLILPTGSNIATQAGDTVVMSYVGGGVWRAFGYSRADGTPLVASHFAGESITMRGTFCPPNSLPEDGRSLAKTAYPQLTAAMGTAWGGTDTTINLPDTRGNFDRGWGLGQGVDPGRVFGSLQDWSLADHSHNVYIGVNSNFSSAFSAGFSSGYRYAVPNISNGVSGTLPGRVVDYTVVNETFNGTINGVVNGTAYGIVSGNTGGAISSSTSNETRSRNITGYRCIFTSTY